MRDPLTATDKNIDGKTIIIHGSMCRGVLPNVSFSTASVARWASFQQTTWTRTAPSTADALAEMCTPCISTHTTYCTLGGIDCIIVLSVYER